MVMGVKLGSKVIIMFIIFVVFVNCVCYCGGEVDFVDIDLKNLLIDFDQFEKKLDEVVVGIYFGVILVDFVGYLIDVICFC